MCWVSVGFACQGASAPRTPFPVHGISIVVCFTQDKQGIGSWVRCHPLCIATPPSPRVLNRPNILEQRRPLTGELQETCTPRYRKPGKFEKPHGTQPRDFLSVSGVSGVSGASGASRYSGVSAAYRSPRSTGEWPALPHFGIGV